uniref:Uncharacterized protein n=1 Tax=Oryza barthii TaxID=65489 RepID=A0A0D3F5L7_9ORYZ
MLASGGGGGRGTGGSGVAGVAGDGAPWRDDDTNRAGLARLEWPPVGSPALRRDDDDDDAGLAWLEWPPVTPCLFGAPTTTTTQASHPCGLRVTVSFSCLYFGLDGLNAYLLI